MDVRTNYSNPNFGMALRVSNREGLAKFLNGKLEKIDEIYTVWELLEKKDKEFMHELKKIIDRHNISEKELPIKQYIPELVIDGEGNLHGYPAEDSFSTRIYEPTLKGAYNYHTIKHYQIARANFNADLDQLLADRAAKVYSERIDRGLDGIMDKFGPKK